MKATTEFQLDFTIVEGNDLPCAAILVAAGNATRMGCNKQLATLQGIPVIARSMIAFQQCDTIRDIVLVTRQEDMGDIQKLAEEYRITKLTAIVEGGADRQSSVENGLQAIADDVLYIAIHDGARPLVTPELISKVVDDAKDKGAATLAVPVKNTIKQAENGIITNTPSRDTLFAVQTPQAFDISVYKQALALAKQHNVAVTDDCSICEYAGYPVYITHSDYRNIKITTPEDLAVAETFLREESV